jgi:hypothetical protein
MAVIECKADLDDGTEKRAIDPTATWLSKVFAVQPIVQSALNRLLGSSAFDLIDPRDV